MVTTTDGCHGYHNKWLLWLPQQMVAMVTTTNGVAIYLNHKPAFITGVSPEGRSCSHIQHGVYQRLIDNDRERWVERERERERVPANTAEMARERGWWWWVLCTSGDGVVLLHSSLHELNRITGRASSECHNN